MFPYSIARLLDELSCFADTSNEIVRSKFHALYFEHYFDALNAKTIVIEKEYIDHDYLEDYAAYYARCFQPYNRYCTRLHFFSCEFNENEFIELIAQNHQSEFEESVKRNYLGYVVVRPLPRTMIGKTCLKTYDSNGRRHYPITRTYKANLYGLQLSIDTLAFQEQDGELSRCATTAVWSALQGTGIIFQHHIPSPAEVTTVANESSPAEGRSIPSDGLNMLQMANAIRCFGLEPLFIQPASHDILKASVYAYLRFGIPVMLGVNVLWANAANEGREDDDLHAVTVTGYSMPLGPSKLFEDSNLRLAALRVDKFYSHDDQIGPFSRMVFRNDSVTVTNPSIIGGLDETKEYPVIETSVVDGPETQVYYADSILVPVYHKIRVSFKAVLDRIMLVNDPLCVIGDEHGLFGKHKIEWDLFLTDVSQYKKDIRNKKETIPESKLKKILFANNPRFMWRAIANVADVRIMDVLFDATDIEQGSFFQDAFLYHGPFTDRLNTIINNPEIVEMTEVEADAPIWRHLRSD